MKLNYINKVKANISIYSNKKTSNILEGTYTSVYKGKSMNFENLREYVINDDVKDIDWKSSARSKTLLVKQFIAEKKHNILFVMDTGKKMNGNTSSNEEKKDIALYSFGTLGYLANKNGDYVGLSYTTDKINIKPFKSNLYNIEEYLGEYDRNACYNRTIDLNDSLRYLYKNIKKRSIFVIITDMEGIDSIKEKVLRELITMHDVLVINIDDTYLTDEQLFDLDSDEYIPAAIRQNKELKEYETKMRKDIQRKNNNKLKKNSISCVTITSKENIIIKIIELLEGHRYANSR